VRGILPEASFNGLSAKIITLLSASRARHLPSRRMRLQRPIDVGEELAK